MMDTMTLTEFLLARIAEDEAEMQRADFVWDYQRLLAECEAKRRIVKTRPFKLLAGAEERQADRLRDQVLRLLALPYADHPDYQQEWKP
jgi:hypothetical protein